MKVCKICGKEHNDSEDICFDCNFWSKKLLQDKENPERIAIIDGTHYFIGDEDSQSGFRGFGGARFQIEFNDGRKVVTTNLWCQGDIPEFWRNKFPDNAKFERNLKWKNLGGETQYLIEE